VRDQQGTPSIPGEIRNDQRRREEEQAEDEKEKDLADSATR
jgi:hypothetical protein